MKKNITIADLEEIKFQADIIAGLSSVFTVYIDCTKEDVHLKGALESLLNEAYKMQDSCDSLLKKYCNCRNHNKQSVK